jgi:hypothetical protein
MGGPGSGRHPCKLSIEDARTRDRKYRLEGPRGALFGRPWSVPAAALRSGGRLLREGRADGPGGTLGRALGGASFRFSVLPRHRPKGGVHGWSR